VLLSDSPVLPRRSRRTLHGGLHDLPLSSAVLSLTKCLCKDIVDCQCVSADYYP
jgi:hypothetical protein